MKNAEKQNKHLMALITFLALVPLVYFIPDYVAHFLSDNKFVNVVVTVGIIVPIISYIIMPIVMKLLKKMGRNLS